jgi:hypothetical protein
MFCESTYIPAFVIHLDRNTATNCEYSTARKDERSIEGASCEIERQH